MAMVFGQANKKPLQDTPRSCTDLGRNCELPVFRGRQPMEDNGTCRTQVAPAFQLLSCFTSGKCDKSASESATAMRASLKNATHTVEASVARLEAWEQRLLAKEAELIAREAELTSHEALISAVGLCHRRHVELMAAKQRVADAAAVEALLDAHSVEAGPLC